MSRRLPGLLPLVAVVATILLLGGCAPASSTHDAAPQPTRAPAAPMLFEVSAGVLEDPAGRSVLCLAEWSLLIIGDPPMCRGPRIEDWSWDGLDPEQFADGSRYGRVTMQGTLVDNVFALTGDVTPFTGDARELDRVPRLGHESSPEPGPLTLAEARRIATRSQRLVPDYLATWAGGGRAFVAVAYDDGSLAEELRARFGTDGVVVESLLHPIIPIG